jgi:ATP-dependent DNA helicase RecQ
LHQASIIQYQPQKDTPQLQLLKNRVKTEDLFINLSLYEKRKQYYTDRLRKMIQYTTDTITCRSIITGNYFGDTAIEKCGVCDNCLRQKQLVITKEEFTAIQKAVQQTLQQHKMTSVALIQSLASFKKEKVYKVLEQLHDEKIISTDAAGNIGLVKF